jgi:hypothetical protein
VYQYEYEKRDDQASQDPQTEIGEWVAGLGLHAGTLGSGALASPSGHAWVKWPMKAMCGSIRIGPPFHHMLTLSAVLMLVK